MRIAIFGGSFDPVHYGHLIMAEHCREQAKLDEVWFVPSFIAPHKRDGAIVSDRQRTELIQLALAGHDAFRFNDIELQRGGISFTVDTLTEIRSQCDHDLFFMMGADSLAQFGSWREPEKICELAIPLVVGRPGAQPVDLQVFEQYVDPQRLDEIREYVIRSPLIEISSTDIRQRVADSRSIRYLTPRAVQKYIENQKLYLAEHSANR